MKQSIKVWPTTELCQNYVRIIEKREELGGVNQSIKVWPTLGLGQDYIKKRVARWR